MPLLLVTEVVRVICIEERWELEACAVKADCEAGVLGERGCGDPKSSPMPLIKSLLAELVVADRDMKVGACARDPGESTDFLYLLLGGMVGVVAAERGEVADDGKAARGGATSVLTLTGRELFLL